jgi:hypothetical protein
LSQSEDVRQALRLEREGRWFKSSYSGGGNDQCVEVTRTSDVVIIRHSKHSTAGTITFTHDQWARFVAEACADSPSNNGAVTVTRISDGGAAVRSLCDGLELIYNAGEWRAFVGGAHDGEFNFRGSSLAELG